MNAGSLLPLGVDVVFWMRGGTQDNPHTGRIIGRYYLRRSYDIRNANGIHADIPEQNIRLLITPDKKLGGEIGPCLVNLLSLPLRDFSYGFTGGNFLTQLLPMRTPLV
jgi:hypothetical protein